MQVCTSLQTDNHTSTPPLSFLQARCPSCHPTNSVKALKAKMKHSNTDPKQNVGAHGFAVSYNRLVLILAIPTVQFNTPAQTGTHNIECPLRMCNSSSFAFLRGILKLRTFSVPQTHPAIFLCSNCSCFIFDPLAVILCCFRSVFNLSDLYFYVCITIVNITRWLLYVLYCKHTSRPSSVLCLCVRYSREWGKGSPYSIAERRVPALIPVLSSHAKHSATEPPIVNITS